MNSSDHKPILAKVKIAHSHEPKGLHLLVCMSLCVADLRTQAGPKDSLLTQDVAQSSGVAFPMSGHKKTHPLPYPSLLQLVNFSVERSRLEQAHI